MLESLTKKQKIIFFIILSAMMTVIIYYIYSTLYSSNFTFSYDNNNLVENVDNTISNIEEAQTSWIVVYVCGAVKESKVVTLKENSRVCDAIDAVGGLSNEADLSNINLAYILEDGEKIYIPKKGEEPQNTSITSSSYYTSYSSSPAKDNKININKATQTELEMIPGVGPSTALKILDYIEKNGKFSKIEDIKNVSGIGDAKYEKMKDYITVK